MAKKSAEPTSEERENMRVEYLVIVEANSPFCRDKVAFNNFLQSDADIKIHKNSLRHKGFECIYELTGGDAEGEKNRFFHVKLECRTDEHLEDFHELLKAVRTLLHKSSDKKPQILWDDVSFYYAQKAYPLVHQIENLMRKLITKFMLTNVGLGWTKEAMPDDLKKDARSEVADNNNNYLYETDFKDLSTFLFDEYRTNDIRALNEKIRGFDGENIPTAELKAFLPKSNWERYFKEYVHCEGTYLQSRWEKLYKLRCKIAHNNTFNRGDFDQTVILIDEVTPKIAGAIANLDRVEVPEDERDELAEIVAIRTSTLYGEYIHRWKGVENLLLVLTEMSLLSQGSNAARYSRSSPSAAISSLLNIGWIGKRTYKALREASQIRNVIVHEPGHRFSSDELSESLVMLDDLNDHLTALIYKHRSQKGNEPGQTQDAQDFADNSE
ncbi:HEPN domain-containing protein [Massilia sp. erpn]|uniref:HEPN domain-containing protein n=1 Tax=Massilia sp. erpn TaxID=2738142 RepID=UPI002106CAC1|nr:HEPN domain-containing protein [Massilia sp. erpn]UTY59811.1 hypothetical protein HPQ68_23085 [Massilia sp. erpn]